MIESENTLIFLQNHKSSMRREDAYVEVEFRIGTKKSKLKALVDTGSTRNIISKD